MLSKLGKQCTMSSGNLGFVAQALQYLHIFFKIYKSDNQLHFSVCTYFINVQAAFNFYFDIIINLSTHQVQIITLYKVGNDSTKCFVRSSEYHK